MWGKCELVRLHSHITCAPQPSPPTHPHLRQDQVGAQYSVPLDGIGSGHAVSPGGLAGAWRGGEGLGEGGYVWRPGHWPRWSCRSLDGGEGLGEGEQRGGRGGQKAGRCCVSHIDRSKGTPLDPASQQGIGFRVLRTHQACRPT